MEDMLEDEEEEDDRDDKVIIFPGTWYLGMGECRHNSAFADS